LLISTGVLTLLFVAVRTRFWESDDPVSLIVPVPLDGMGYVPVCVFVVLTYNLTRALVVLALAV